MDVKTKTTLMNVMDSYWSMLPPELQDFILLLKRNQEMFDQEKERKMKELSKEIVLYKELKDKWALGHIRCVVKKKIFFERYIVIMGSYLDRGDNGGQGFSIFFNAVKCYLTKLTTTRSWYLSSGQRFAVGRAGSVPPSVVVCFSMAYQSGL